MAKVFYNPINIDKFDYVIIDTKEIKTVSANLPIISYGFAKDKLQKVDCF